MIGLECTACGRQFTAGDQVEGSTRLMHTDCLTEET